MQGKKKGGHATGRQMAQAQARRKQAGRTSWRRERADWPAAADVSGSSILGSPVIGRQAEGHVGMCLEIGVTSRDDVRRVSVGRQSW